jgi:membrane peptidoglycan carboxypeptidase
MPYGIADSEQLAMLTTVLDGYCREAGLEPKTRARDRAGRVLMALYCNGAATAQELAAALAVSLADESRR